MSVSTVTADQINVMGDDVTITHPDLKNKEDAYETFKTVDPALSPDQVSVDEGGKVIINNHTFAEAMAGRLARSNHVMQPQQTNNNLLCGVGPNIICI